MNIRMTPEEIDYLDWLDQNMSHYGILNNEKKHKGMFIRDRYCGINGFMNTDKIKELQ